MSAFAISPTTLSRETFVSTFGGGYEHSSWIAERAFDAGLTKAADTPDGLSVLLRAQVEAAGEVAQLSLLRAHPDLAGKLATSGQLTAASTTEQAGAGLDACTDDEFERFQALNKTYVDRFGFPFILAVAGRQRTEILENFEQRVDNDPDTEFREALDQVHRIALLRLHALTQERSNP